MRRPVLILAACLLLAAAPLRAAQAADAPGGSAQREAVEAVRQGLESVGVSPAARKAREARAQSSPFGQQGQPAQQGQTGPKAPAQPTAPVVPATAAPAGSPAGSSAATPQTPLPPLPGSPFRDARDGREDRAVPSAASVAQSAPSAPLGKAGRKAQPSAQMEAKPQPQHEELLRLESGGVERQAILTIPKAAAVKKSQPQPKRPVLLFLHGAAGSARQAMRQTGLAERAARAGYLAVFPEGLGPPEGTNSSNGSNGGNGGGQTWNAWMCCGYARDAKIDDVGFLAALISRLVAEHRADPRRIHLAGFSNGAMLASRFALERPGVAASIAIAAGYLPCDANPPETPLPVLILHGNRDRIARFGPTETHPRTGRYCEDFPAKAQVDFWTRGMGLPAKASQVQDGRKTRIRVERYGPAKKNPRALVEFVIVKGGGHAWPGGTCERYRYCDAPTPDPDATGLVLDFFNHTGRGPDAAKPAPETPEPAKKKPAKTKKKARN